MALFCFALEGRSYQFVDLHAQLCIADGIEAVAAIARRKSTCLHNESLEENFSRLDLLSRNSISEGESDAAAEELAAPFQTSRSHDSSNGNIIKDEKLHILIIDADSEDPR